ncbi:MAG: hypothetical protein JST86_20570 [Bacteroidetes bacterium]|nr:hypothetical protein [Bacteroidota bacterium]
MKKLLIAVVLICSVSGYTATAQVRVNVGVNIGVQPQWGPAGYDYAEYYYMPDMDVYYDVPHREFIYLQGRNWVFGASLPVQYRNYDLYHCYKVVVNEPRPYLRAEVYRTRYAGYRGRGGQEANRERWQRHDNGNHYGWRNKELKGRGRGHH